MTFGPITTARKRRRFAVYDLEWIPHTLELRLIGTFDGKQYRSYTTVADFLNAELLSVRAGNWWYAHAGGLFDLRFLLDQLVANPRVRVHAAFSGSAAIIARISKGGRRIVPDEGLPYYAGEKSWYFVDSYWLLRQPLRKIGQWLGMAKGGEARETRERCRFPDADCTCDPIFRAPLSVLREYNEQDCRILWTAIDRFESTLMDLGGELQMTVASSAMRLFRRAYLTREIETSAAVNAIARSAYVGSRVEVFEHSCKEADYYDINSSFPHAMTLPAPANVLRSGRSRPKGERAIYLARARVTVPETVKVPPLPYRTPDRRVYFPVGTWEAWFDGVDLDWLEECGGRIESVTESIEFEPFEDLARYATDIYEMRRKTNDPANKAILKILLNSLYGKFAEGTNKQSLEVHPPHTRCTHLAEGEPQHTAGGVPGSCWEYLSAGIWIHSDERSIAHEHVPIACHITAIARRSLGRWIRQADRVYYCDTDGFACEPQVLPTSDELGALKHEATISRGVFVAPKLYALRGTGNAWKVRAKGFRGLDYGELIRLLEAGEVIADHFVRIREGLRKGALGPEEIKIAKGLGARSADGKRRIKLRPKRAELGDGRTRPWNVDELAGKMEPIEIAQILEYIGPENL